MPLRHRAARWFVFVSLAACTFSACDAGNAVPDAGIVLDVDDPGVAAIADVDDIVATRTAALVLSLPPVVAVADSTIYEGSGDENAGSDTLLNAATEGSAFVAAIVGFDGDDVRLPPGAGPLQGGRYELAIESCMGIGTDPAIDLVVYIVTNDWVESAVTAACGNEAIPGDGSAIV